MQGPGLREARAQGPVPGGGGTLREESRARVPSQYLQAIVQGAAEAGTLKGLRVREGDEPRDCAGVRGGWRQVNLQEARQRPARRLPERRGLRLRQPRR